MDTGFTNDEGTHFEFREIEADRKDLVMNNIKRFFETYPTGIITFG